MDGTSARLSCRLPRTTGRLTNPKRAVSALIAALKDENQHVRFDAVCALGSISPQDEAVVAALIPMLHDTSPIVRARTSERGRVLRPLTVQQNDDLASRRPFPLGSVRN
jgi:hypothetical protein